MSQLISVIIPVYNTSSYLDKCLDHVTKQTYKNLEIIVVNDGSTDGSDKIIDKYAKKDNRIKVITQHNRGVSVARNKGLEIATGNLIGFVDSDDYISLDFFETLYKTLKDNDADIAMVGNYIDTDGNLTSNSSNQLYQYTQIEVIKRILLNKEIKAHLCNKLFKRELFDQILFPEGAYYEDDAVIFDILKKIKKFVYLDVPKYYYVKRKGSIVNTPSYEVRKFYIKNVLSAYESLKNIKELEETLAYYVIDSFLKCYVYGTDNGIKKLVCEIEKQLPWLEKLSKKCLELINNEFTAYNKMVFYALLWKKEVAYKIVSKYKWYE